VNCNEKEDFSAKVHFL